MHCTNCALGVHRNLEKQGLSDVYVNFATDEVRFSIEHPERLPEIIDSIEDLGFRVENTVDTTAETLFSSVERRFYFTLPFSALLFSHMLLPLHWLHLPYVQLAVCLPVVIMGWVFFGKSAWTSLKSGVPNMDVLIFIGFSSAFIYSLTGTLLHLGENYLFYETSATIVTLVLLGNVLEKKSVNQTTSALKDLSAIQHTPAKLVVGNAIEEVDSKSINVNDIVLVNTGDRIPIDGEIMSGTAAIDEAMISGESLPVNKTVGDAVTGGTILSQGSIYVKAVSVGKHTVVAQIINMIKTAQSSHPPIQKLGDRVSAIFVPVVLGIALLTFFVSYMIVGTGLQHALLAAIAVLVISCPCAMGLATPTAVMVGIGRAAKNGILIKGGATLEQFAPVRTIIFDKTGTLTTGKFSINQLSVYGIDEQEAKEVLVKLEQFSTHPLAIAIVKEWKAFNSTRIIQHINEEKGIGIKAIDEQGNAWFAGSYLIAQKQSKDSSHSIYLLKNEALVATVDLVDEIRKGAAEMIQALQQQGVEPILLSGDRRAKCEAVAEQLGIQKIYAEQLPQQKLALIQELRKNGAVAMVGDGINDAPALAQADIGISLGSATQIAIQSANIVLLGENLQSLTTALAISKHTLLTIKQNLFWAFCYNIIAIPVAAMGLLNPMIGALTMAFSDVIVIGNSIRLKGKKLS